MNQAWGLCWEEGRNGSWRFTAKIWSKKNYTVQISFYISILTTSVDPQNFVLKLHVIQTKLRHVQTKLRGMQNAQNLTTEQSQGKGIFGGILKVKGCIMTKFTCSTTFYFRARQARHFAPSFAW